MTDAMDQRDTKCLVVAPRLPYINVTDTSNTKKRRINANGNEDLMDLKESIVANFSQLYLSQKFSDITIKVDNESIACHKSILGSQSDFFDRLFETDMMEATQAVIELKDTDPQVFRLLLKLTYFGQLDFNDLLPSDIIKLYGLIQRYQFALFEEPYLLKTKSVINKTNLWPMLDTCVELQVIDCLNICLDYLNCCKDHTIFQTHDFLQISAESLKTLLTYDLLNIPEIHLFLATEQWLRANKVAQQCAEELLQCIRLTLIRFEDLMNYVSKSGLIPETQLMEVMRTKGLADNWEGCKSEGIQRRAFIVYDTNLCTDAFRYEVCEGRVGTQANKSDPNSPQIVVRFGFPFNINFIELKLSEVRGDRFSYKIEYSVEGHEWKTLYDYMNYTTANYQKLYFEPIVAQLFRIAGSHQLRMDATTKTAFDAIEGLSCYHNKGQHMVERIKGLLSNPFWIRQSVQQRVYHDTNSAANGPPAGASNHTKYYSRKLSSNKPIIVALDQPVMIDSFQFQLYDKDDRAYSYVVEMKDQNDWIKLADKSLDKCRSLQTISFTRRPVSMVRVRGTQIHFVDCTEFRIIKFHFPRVGF